MPEITEKYVKERVKKIIELYKEYNPIYTCCPMTFGFGESGHPDRFVLLYGVLIGIEVKRDKNNHHIRPELKAKPNEIMQKRQGELIKSAGGEWVCIHSGNLQSLVDLFDKHAKIKSLEFKHSDVHKIAKLVGVYD